MSVALSLINHGFIDFFSINFNLISLIQCKSHFLFLPLFSVWSPVMCAVICPLILTINPCRGPVFWSVKSPCIVIENY